MSPTAAVIFDLDGVLVDSSPAHFESWQIICQELGWTMSRAMFETTFGRTSREIIREFWGQQVSSEAEVAAIDERKEAKFRELLVRDFPAMDGATALLDQLFESGWPLAIGSSAPPDNVHLALECLQRRHYFSAVVSGGDVRRGKPDPQVYQLAAERLGIAPRHCVVIEDAVVGVQAAHGAGMKCIGVLTTVRDRQALAAADLVVGSLKDLNPARIRSVLTAGHAAAK